MKKTKFKMGIWAGILSAIFSILWFITFSMKDTIQAMPDWHNLEAYAEAYSLMRFIYLFPSLLLPISYIILLVCLHLTINEDKKLWSLIALAIGIVYATMASINYNIQAVAVRLSLAAGETQGIEMFIPDNPNSIFNALANSYIYLAGSMFFTGFIFTNGQLAKWIRGLLWAQIITAIGQVGYSMFDMAETIFIVTSMVWVLGAPAAFIMIAIWFRKRDQFESGSQVSKANDQFSIPLILF